MAFGGEKSGRSGLVVREEEEDDEERCTEGWNESGNGGNERNRREKIRARAGRRGPEERKNGGGKGRK